MEDDGGFLRWFVPWRGARTDETPIGWYGLADLKDAFDAGMAAEQQRATAELLRDIRKKD